ncbi:hypothetical protein D3C72_1118940 [compost metagenome]
MNRLTQGLSRKGCLDSMHQANVIPRLCQKIAYAALHRRNGQRNISVRGHRDDIGWVGQRPQLRQNLHTFATIRPSRRKIQIEENNVRTIACEPCGQLCRMVKCRDLRNVPAQQHTRCQRHVCIVVEDQYICVLAGHWK